eukprot:3575774-Pyramimonas_sp.AAC.1
MAECMGPGSVVMLAFDPATILTIVRMRRLENGFQGSARRSSRLALPPAVIPNARSTRRRQHLEGNGVGRGRVPVLRLQVVRGVPGAVYHGGGEAGVLKPNGSCNAPQRHSAYFFRNGTRLAVELGCRNGRHSVLG